ncbi:MFS general substrate transporter [Aspergillus sclerotiicarbonarius CBS 121057]|uniref:MFS general substrate transporter n=1 Tax=Aspergillus sclerotiicarbonarius (strain CBS 121057 / IBT 28362) TaxID=1448318 RepID=A0A319E1G7_ASPSB|nr:MFS general substrate transporter [Aspergillus sclerotiicarbonarius CBS 121057]
MADDAVKGVSVEAERSPTEDKEMTPQEQRRVIRRVDMQLIVMLGLLHTVSLIDRGNLSTAAVAGMLTELHLHGNEYASCPPFTQTICMLGPALIRKLGPRVFLASICFIWGVTMTQLVGIQIIIGALEAGFSPAAVYLIATWYTRYQTQKRFAIFYLLGSNLSSWRWIFIIQCLLTCALACISYFILIDFPDRMKSTTSTTTTTTQTHQFLSPHEYNFIIQQIHTDRADATLEPFNLKKYLLATLDINIWALGLIYFCTTTTTTAYSIAYFLPLIYRQGMGFSEGASLCLFAPPYIAAGVMMWFTSWFGDRFRVRGPVLVFNALLTVVGLPLMTFTNTNGVNLLGCFFATMSANSNVPAAMAYQANNTRGQWTRAACSVIFVGLDASGGMVGSLVFRSQDTPQYRVGIYMCIGTSVGVVLLVVGLTGRV